MTAAPVTIRTLTKRFGDICAVDDVSLEIEAGELFFLLGPSGCGKTTLLRCIAGFYDPDAGGIRIGDDDVTRFPPHRRDTGMVFQSYALWPHMTVRQNVAFGLEMRRVTKAETARRVDDALAMVKMSEKAQSKPNELSGGQQQRVALARALVIHPKCLLLDEPLSNLDAKLRLEMRSEIRRICKQAGLTAIYVTHDQKEALSVADRLAVLEDGKIRQVGVPQDVYRNPVSRFVAGFIGEANFLGGEVLDVAGTEVSVHTALGLLRGRRPNEGTLAAGADVTVCIRPEAVTVGTPPTSGVNAFQGSVHDTVYLGEVAQHVVDVSGENGASVAFKVAELNPRIVARDTAREAPVWADPNDVVVLSD